MSNVGDEAAYGSCLITFRSRFSGSDIGEETWTSTQRLDPDSKQRLRGALFISENQKGLVKKPRITDCGAVSEGDPLDVHPYITFADIAFTPLNEVDLAVSFRLINSGEESGKAECSVFAFEYGRIVGSEILSTRRKIRAGGALTGRGILIIEDEGAQRVTRVALRDCGVP